MQMNAFNELFYNICFTQQIAVIIPVKQNYQLTTFFDNLFKVMQMREDRKKSRASVLLR